MKRKRHTPQEVIAKLREAEVDLNQGATIEAVCRKLENQRADLSSLAASLRWDERARDGADERIGKRKCAVEEDRGAAGHGHRRAEGH